MPRPRLAAALTIVLVGAACAHPGGGATSAAPTPTLSAAPTAVPSSIDPDRPTAALADVAVPGMAAAPGTDLAAYTRQQLTWRDCGALQCAQVLAPEDYAQPARRAITLTVRRTPPAGTSRGIVFVDPGGPGATTDGILASPSHRAALDGFDLVGVDPRGSAGSTPVVCYEHQDQPLPQVAAQVAVDSSPDDEQEFRALEDSQQGFAEACAQRSGAYLQHIGTADAARDLDLVRGLLGLDTLNYVGWSAGTLLGAWYATLFPATTGRLVLDGPMTLTDDSVGQAVGFERAFDAFAEWSGSRDEIGAGPDAVKQRLAAWLDGLDTKPLAVGDRQLTQSVAVAGVAAFLYGDAQTYSALQFALKNAYAGQGGALLDAGLGLLGIGKDGVADELYYAFPAISCVDQTDHGVAGARATWAQDEAKAPLFGRYFGPNLTCVRWAAAASDQQPQATVATAPLVIGTTLDPATPYENAAILARQVGGRVLTFDSAGHAAFGHGNQCVDAAVRAYLADATLPADGTRCHA